MVQFLSILFFLGFLQFLFGFSKVPVLLCHSVQSLNDNNWTLLLHQPASILVSAHNTHLSTGQFYVHLYTPLLRYVPHASTQQCSQLLLVTSRVHLTAHVRLSHAVHCLLSQLTSSGWPKDNVEGSELLLQLTRSWLDLLETVLLFSALCVSPCRNSGVAVRSVPTVFLVLRSAPRLIFFSFPYLNLCLEIVRRHTVSVT